MNKKILFLSFLLLIIKTNFLIEDTYFNTFFVRTVKIKYVKSNILLNKKGDIPEFCEREIIPIAIQSSKLIKISNNAREKLDNSKQQSTNINNYYIYYNDFLLNFFLLYLVLIFLSYLKWFEEMYLVILDYIHRRYFNFFDLTNPTNIEYFKKLEFKGKYIYNYQFYHFYPNLYYLFKKKKTN